jgi:hypothetical protein
MPVDTKLDQLVSSGSSLFVAVPIADHPVGGDIGPAATTVEIATTFNVTQTTPGQVLSLPPPTSTTSGRVAIINSVPGNVTFTMLGAVIGAGSSIVAIWNGTAWSLAAGTGGSGVPSSGGMGELFINDNAVATAITTIATYTKIEVPLWTLGPDVMDFDSPVLGRLRYIGAQSRVFHCGATISLTSVSPNDVVRAVLYKNGVVNAAKEFTPPLTGRLSAGIVEQKLGGSGDVTSTALHVFTPMSTGDYLELGIANMTGASGLTISFANVFSVGMDPL